MTGSRLASAGLDEVSSQLKLAGAWIQSPSVAGSRPAYAGLDGWDPAAKAAGSVTSAWPGGQASVLDSPPSAVRDHDDHGRLTIMVGQP